LHLDGKTEYGEVQFYFQYFNQLQELELRALVSMYGPPDEDMLQDSSQTLWACRYSGSNNLKVVHLPEILSVVSVQPFPRLDDNDPQNLWFVVEKPGLDDVELDDLFQDNEGS